MVKLLKTIPGFPVESIGKAVEFYKDKLGFECRFQKDDFAALIRSEIELHLWASCDYSWKFRGDSLSAEPIKSGAESFLAGTSGCRIEVTGIDELYAELASKKVLLNETTVVETTDWGSREFEASDLDGNLLTFFENVE